MQKPSKLFKQEEQVKQAVMLQETPKRLDECMAWKLYRGQYPHAELEEFMQEVEERVVDGSSQEYELQVFLKKL